MPNTKKTPCTCYACNTARCLVARAREVEQATREGSWALVQSRLRDLRYLLNSRTEDADMRCLHNPHR